MRKRRFVYAPPSPMDAIAAVAVLIVIAAAIGVLCWLWMRSTRASQGRVEAQNQRIIELLEQIATNTRKD